MSGRKFNDLMCRMLVFYYFKNAKAVIYYNHEGQAASLFFIILIERFLDRSL